MISEIIMIAIISTIIIPLLGHHIEDEVEDECLDKLMLTYWPSRFLPGLSGEGS